MDHSINSKLPQRAEFKSCGGHVSVNGHEGVFPICTRNTFGRIVFVATGFFIGSHGVFATAKHVLAERDQTWIQDPFTVHFLQDGTYVCRPIREVSVHPTSDIAVGILYEMKDPQGQILRNRVLQITDRIPQRTEFAATFAYPKTTVTHETDGTSVFFNTTWHFGIIEEYFPDGRDRVLLPGRCFQTNIEILGGASGGPVADERGYVFGVNSTGFHDEGGTVPVSYVSSILDILPLGFDGVVLPGQPSGNRVRISDLIAAGFIPIQH